MTDGVRCTAYFASSKEQDIKRERGGERDRDIERKVGDSVAICDDDTIDTKFFKFYSR